MRKYEMTVTENRKEEQDIEDICEELAKEVKQQLYEDQIFNAHKTDKLISISAFKVGWTMGTEKECIKWQKAIKRAVTDKNIFDNILKQYEEIEDEE